MTAFHKVQNPGKKRGGQLHPSQTLSELRSCSDLVIFFTDGPCGLSDKSKISGLRVKMSIFQASPDMTAGREARADNLL